MPQEPIVEPGGVAPVHIVPAATPIEPIAAYEPTRVIPQVPYQAVVAPTMQPVAPVTAGPMFVDERRPAWPYLLALLALLVGGLVGFLIGNSRRDDTTALTSSTVPVGSTVDSTVGSTATVADLQNQVALLTAAQTKAAQDLTDAQTALIQTQAERDALAAQVGTAGGTSTGLQADLDASKAQVAKLQGDVSAATASLTQTQALLKTVQGQLDALHPTPLGNYVNGSIGKVQADAQANGWTVIEQPGNSPTAAVGTVLEQSPAPNTTMVVGSVLYVTVK